MKCFQVKIIFGPAWPVSDTKSTCLPPVYRTAIFNFLLASVKGLARPLM